MKVLILSVKAGFGHHSTAQAIIDYFDSRDIECTMLDTFEYINPVLADSIDNGYLFSTKYIPDIYGKAYDMLDGRVQKWDKHSIVSILSKLVSNKLKDYIIDYEPDIIIGTHSYACMMMTYLKEKEFVSCPLIGVVTDFTVHPFWESTDLDYYVTADSLLDNQMQKKGIDSSKILPFGIPIKSKFSQKIEKAEARKLLKIKDKNTILIMMGSMGFGNIVEEIAEIDNLDIDFQILCVCGKNEKMYKEITERSWKKDIIAYGFVDNVDVMMDASDCIITKPGGLTTSELLAKGLPAIIMNPIRGQEDRNMEFLVNNGAAIMSTYTYRVDEALFQLMRNEKRLEMLKSGISYLAKPDSTKNLCEFIINLCKKEQD